MCAKVYNEWWLSRISFAQFPVYSCVHLQRIMRNCIWAYNCLLLFIFLLVHTGAACEVRRSNWCLCTRVCGSSASCRSRAARGQSLGLAANQRSVLFRSVLFVLFFISYCFLWNPVEKMITERLKILYILKQIVFMMPSFEQSSVLVLLNVIVLLHAHYSCNRSWNKTTRILYLPKKINCFPFRTRNASQSAAAANVRASNFEAHTHKRGIHPRTLAWPQYYGI